MPREFTHWKAAEKVAANLKNTIYDEPVQKYKNIFLLGSNFHDSLFYATKLNKKSSIALIPNILHGSNKEDTFSIVNSTVDLIIEKEDNQHIIAFLVGMITHIFTDSLFHPMVFYYSGHYSKTDKRMKKANQYHHKLEALIEFYFAAEKIKNRTYLLKDMINKAEYPLNKLISDVIKYYIKENTEPVSEAVLSGYYHLASTQSLGTNKIANSLADIFYPVLPNRLKDLVSIRYDVRLIKQTDKIKGNLVFKNPITGEEFITTLDVLLETAVEKSIDFCLNIEKFIINKRSLSLTYKGSSLKSGISDSTVIDMKYFAQAPIVV